MYLPELACYHEILVMIGTITYILVLKLRVPGFVARHQSGSRCSYECKDPFGAV
jgi:hypothetical protein